MHVQNILPQIIGWFNNEIILKLVLVHFDVDCQNLFWFLDANTVVLENT